jgi:hypothetical protein
MQFKFFFFEPLKYGRAIDHLSRDAYSAEVIRGFYLQWTLAFCRKSLIYYQHQYRQHAQLTWSEFCSNYDIPIYEHPGSYDLSFEWEAFKEEYSLNEHYRQQQEMIERVTELQAGTERELENTASLPSDMEETMKELDKVWFNNLIDNPFPVIEQLKALDYKAYLKTEHWKRVQAAIFLIHNATCQSLKCSVTGESWYGGSESELGVYHVDQSNLGHERYDDLALLCKQHRIQVSES